MEKFLILTMFALGILTFGKERSTQIMNHNNKNFEFLEVYQPKEITKSSETTNYSWSETFTTDENQDTMYCLLRDRNEFGSYNGKRAQFSVWKPKSGASCCVIVNISRGDKIIARQRVTVTNAKMLRVLIGEVDGVTQGVSPCN